MATLPENRLIGMQTEPENLTGSQTRPTRAQSQKSFRNQPNPAHYAAVRTEKRPRICAAADMVTARSRGGPRGPQPAPSAMRDGASFEQRKELAMAKVSRIRK